MDKKNKKPEVTVAISAYNEEKNIVNFLKSVMLQKEQGFVLKQIWIHSDGSTDNTVKHIKKIKSKKIKVWDHKKRVGKSTWLNKIYNDLDTDILVQSDADVVFAHKMVIHDLIQPLIKNAKVGMVGGNPMPIDGETFIEKAINCSVIPYLQFRKRVRGGNNMFSADGRLLAFKNEVVKKIHVPKTMIANDMYTYFACLSLGYAYNFIDSAVVLFRSPQTLKDHIKQNVRFRAAPIRMTNYFPKALVTRESSLPFLIYLECFAKQFVKNPVHATFIYVANKYCELKALINEKKLTAKWPVAITTKYLK